MPIWNPFLTMDDFMNVGKKRSADEDQDRMMDVEESPSEPPKKESWRIKTGRAYIGNQYPEATDEDVDQGMREAMRRFGQALLAAGVSPDYRSAAKNIAAGLAQQEGTVEEYVDKAVTRRRGLREQEQKDKAWEMDQERASLTIDQMRHDKTVRDSLKEMAKDEADAFEKTFNAIIDDPDVKASGKADVFKKNMSAYLNHYRATGDPAAMVRVANYLSDVGDVVGRSELVSQNNLDMLIRGAMENGFSTDEEGLRQYNAYLKEKTGIGLSQSKLNLALSRQAEKVGAERIKQEGIQTGMMERGQELVDTGKYVPAGVYPVDRNQGEPEDVDPARVETAVAQTFVGGIESDSYREFKRTGKLDMSNPDSVATIAALRMAGFDIDEKTGKMSPFEHMKYIRFTMGDRSAKRMKDPGTAGTPPPTPNLGVGIPSPQDFLNSKYGQPVIGPN